jgi:hypothetical protein
MNKKINNITIDPEGVKHEKQSKSLENIEPIFKFNPFRLAI